MTAAATASKPPRQRKPKAPLVATMLEIVTRWQVSSASRPGMAHVVDLTSFWNFGECSCENFEFNKRPLLVRGQIPETRCAHILCARNAYADATLAAISKNAMDEGRRTQGTADTTDPL